MNTLTCIVCPKGCRMTVLDKDSYAVSGNACARGARYAKSELSCPTRTLTSTVIVEHSIYAKCPVKSSGVIPKNLLFDVMKELRHVKLIAPIKLGQIVISNVCNTGVDIITTRSMPKII